MESTIQIMVKEHSLSAQPSGSCVNWKDAFEAALMESNPDLFTVRLDTARDAIVREIESTFDHANWTDRRLLLAALNTIGGLYESDFQRARPHVFGHSA
jgi:hypothetical protein